MSTAETWMWLFSLGVVAAIGWLLGYVDGVRRSRRGDDE
jgi:pheromone shutdown protein TraB